MQILLYRGTHTGVGIWTNLFGKDQNGMSFGMEGKRRKREECIE
jgi:hypothetical protein